MTIRSLGKMFKPQSLALVGASNRPGSVGWVLMQNVLKSGFLGPIMPVNPKHAAIGGIIAYPDIASLPVVPDLAVLTLSPEHVPAMIAELGARGTKAAVVITAGFSEIGTAEGKQLEQAMLDAAKPHTLRIIGPNCLGIMAPGAQLNASFAHIPPERGSLAFVSQSGALCTAILDYVAGRDIGFSHFVSLGNSADVDFGDMLDYLAADSGTSAILLYIESVRSVRKFMSAARAASRNKPVIVIKSGRNAQGAKAASSHTGALVGADAVYDAAFKRAGMLRVDTMDALFDAVETLARIGHQPQTPRLAANGRPDRLAIVTNGGGPAVLATDYLINAGGVLAALSPETINALNAVLPPTWSHGNPIDIIGDADGKRYNDALHTVLQAPEADAVFVMKCPTAVSDNMEAAQAVIQAAANAPDKTLFTCWLGEATAHASRRAFAEANIATYETPEKAIYSFLHIAEYRHNQALLIEAPSSAYRDYPRDTARARAIIAEALAQGRHELFEDEAKEVFAAYHIPVVRTLSVSTVEDAMAAADNIGYPVALKIRSPDISHKSDVGGVVLSLANKEDVRQAAEHMLQSIGSRFPEARLEGFSVQQMVARRNGYELIIGVSTDRQFGPVIMFGEGGVAVEVLNDKALGLPPLNKTLAMDMIKTTRVYNRLKGFRDRQPVNMDMLADCLVQVSQLVTDIADIAELDINPLIADHEGAIALDGRIKIEPSALQGSARLAISPYPSELEETKTLKNGLDVVMRPVRPEDAQALKAMVEQLTPEDLYHRFLGEVPVVAPDQVARLTHIDYARDMVFVAMHKDEMLACLLCTMHPGEPVAEFTLAVRSDHQGQGLGHALTQKILDYLASKPLIQELYGYVLPGNRALLEMVKQFGFQAEDYSSVQAKPMLKVSKDLR